MLRLTAFLIVVTLTGLPVVPAACLTWCGEHRTTTGSCYDEAVKNGSPVITAGSATCTAVTERPFIREEGRPVLHAVHAVPVFRIAAVIPAAHAFVGHRGTTDSAPQPRFVLRA